MKQEHMQSLIEVLPFLQEIFRIDMTIAIADMNRYLAIKEGIQIHGTIQEGSQLELNPFLENIMKNKQSFCAITEPGYFNVPAQLIVTPIVNMDNSGAGFVFVAKNMEQQVWIKYLQI